MSNERVMKNIAEGSTKFYPIGKEAEDEKGPVDPLSKGWIGERE